MKPAYGVKNSTGVNFGRASKPNSVGELTTFPSRIPKSRLGREIFSQHILSTSAKPLLVMTAVIWRGGSMPVPSSFIANTQNELCSFYAKIDLI